jgi:hypothetical protein
MDAAVKQTALHFLSTERRERELKVERVRKPFGNNLTKALEAEVNGHEREIEAIDALIALIENE